MRCKKHEKERCVYCFPQPENSFEITSGMMEVVEVIADVVIDEVVDSFD